MTISKKNKFWNVCISCVPGAGQMYQGFLKRGVSLMLIFCGLLCLMDILYINWFVYAVPVVWCYSFFDSINTNSLPDEEFNMLKDEYLFIQGNENFNFNMGKIRIPAAVLLIITGSYILFENMLYILDSIFRIRFSNIIYRLMDYFPRFVFSILIILIGLYLIKGKKTQMDNSDIYGKEKEEI